MASETKIWESCNARVCIFAGMSSCCVQASELGLPESQKNDNFI